MECLINQPLKDSVITLQKHQINDLAEVVKKQELQIDMSQLEINNLATIRRQRWWMLGGGVIAGFFIGVIFEK